MNKIIYLILIISVLLISGCLDNQGIELTILNIEQINNTIPEYKILFIDENENIKYIETNNTLNIICLKLNRDNEYSLYTSNDNLFNYHTYHLYIPLNDLQIKNNT